MAIIDAQVHTYEIDHPGRPWDPNFGRGGAPLMHASGGRAEQTAVPRGRMVEAMDAAGIAAAILVATSHYGWDNSYSLEAAQLYPGRFAVVGRINHTRTDVNDAVQAWCSTPAAIGLRIVIVSEAAHYQVLAGHYAQLLRAAQRHSVPICVFPPRHLSDVAVLARAYPELQLIVDHLGLPQPPLITPDYNRFQRLPELLALAEFPNVAVKMTAVPTLSAEEFPYRDIWSPLRKVIDVFGPHRVMWGTDWPRVMELLTLEEGRAYVTESDWLTSVEKDLVLGGAAQRVFAWNP